MKRVVAAILVMALVLASISTLAGCGDKGGEAVHILTRAEWIEELASRFGMDGSYEENPFFEDVTSESPYYNQVQACVEWGVLEDEDAFRPDERADVEFAIVTAVKAIGLEKIEKSVDGEKLESDEDIIDYFKEHSSSKFMAGSALYANTAVEILQGISQIYNGMELTQYQDIAYQDNVMPLTEQEVNFSADGQSGKMKAGEVKVGDIIVIEPSLYYPEGKSAKIVSVDGENFTYVQPELEEILEHATICGTYEPEILGVVPLSEGIEIKAIDGVEAVPQAYHGSVPGKIMYVRADRGKNGVENVGKTYEMSDIEIYLDGSMGSKTGDAVGVTGSVKIKDIKMTIDYQSTLGVVHSADIKMDENIQTNIKVYAKKETKINLAQIYYGLGEIGSVRIDLQLKIGVEGEVTVEWNVNVTEGLEYEMFKMPKYTADAESLGFNVGAKVKAKILVQPSVAVVLFGLDLASIGAYTGLEGSIAAPDLAETCIDLKLHVPLVVYINSEVKGSKGTVLGKLGVKKTWTIWDSSNSAVKMAMHIEDGEIVPECTKGKKDSADDVASEEDVDNIDYEFIENRGDMFSLQLSSYIAYLDEGQTDKIQLLSMPEDYKWENIVFSSSDNSIVEVDAAGNLYGKAAGSCVIKVETADQKYVQYCAVHVLASYDVEFEPLPDFDFDWEEEKNEI